MANPFGAPGPRALLWALALLLAARLSVVEGSPLAAVLRGPLGSRPGRARGGGGALAARGHPRRLPVERRRARPRAHALRGIGGRPPPRRPLLHGPSSGLRRRAALPDHGPEPVAGRGPRPAEQLRGRGLAGVHARTGDAALRGAAARRPSLPRAQSRPAPHPRPRLRARGPGGVRRPARAHGGCPRRAGEGARRAPDPAPRGRASSRFAPRWGRPSSSIRSTSIPRSPRRSFSRALSGCSSGVREFRVRRGPPSWPRRFPGCT